MKTIVLEVEKRTTIGKKVKTLRRTGITPANIFGHGIKSQAIQIKTDELEKTLSKAGATHMISLKNPSFKEDCQVLTRGVRRDCLSGKLIHIDFYQVSMKDKVKVVIPIVFKGEAPAARRKDLVVLQSITSVEVECLPNAIPETIEVDMTSLKEAGDHILVKDLKMVEGVAILAHPDEVLARISTIRAEEVKPVAEGEAAAVAEAAPEAGAKAGEKVAEKAPGKAAEVPGAKGAPSAKGGAPASKGPVKG